MEKTTKTTAVRPDAFDRAAALEVIATRPGGDKLMDLTFLHAIAAPRRKRALSLHDDNDSDDTAGTTADDATADSTSGDGSSDATDSPQPSVATKQQRQQQQQLKKQRKPTHVLRKEAKAKLLDELRHLEARAALLRQETGQADPRELQDRYALSADLREAILQRDLVIATSQSAISGYMNARVDSPLTTHIHLPVDWSARRTILLGLKDCKVRNAHRFITERTRHMNKLQAASEVSQFETTDGDICVTKVDVTPFEGVSSVQQVFAALQFYYQNLEISLSDMSGTVTIRENDDDAIISAADHAVLQHRLVSAERSGALVEKNAVVFIDHSDWSTGADKQEEQWAIAVGDFVDQDDLYPYVPTQRIRKDSTSVAKLSAHWRPRRPGLGAAPSPFILPGTSRADDDSELELVVVLTRWHLMRLHRPAFALAPSVLSAIASEQSDALNVMLRSMRQGLVATRSASASWD